MISEEPPSFEGKRVFVVEDSPLIADLIQDLLQDLGCELVGPTGNMGIAIEQAANLEFDAAIIDVNIRGGKVFPVAEILQRRGIPFLLASGYAKWDIPEQYGTTPRLHKPYTKASVRDGLEVLFQGHTESSRFMAARP